MRIVSGEGDTTWTLGAVVSIEKLQDRERRREKIFAEVYSTSTAWVPSTSETAVSAPSFRRARLEGSIGFPSTVTETEPLPGTYPGREHEILTEAEARRAPC